MKAESHSTCGAEPSSLGVGDQPAKGEGGARGGGGAAPPGICLEAGMGKGVRVHVKKTAGGELGNACYD